MKHDNLPDATQQTAQAQFSSLAEPLVDDAIAAAGNLQSDPDAEALHKLRVALRRLRTLLWAYRPLLNREFYDKQRAFFKFLAGAAGKTRDWDILIQLLCELRGRERASFDDLRSARGNALETSRETLTQAGIKPALRDALKEANTELNTAPEFAASRKFARQQVAVAQKSFRKRVRRAARARRSDYASFHAVRKAGKKLRYLLEFFEPSLKKKQVKGVRKLKKIQKRFGELNDVVASENLVRSNLGVFRDRSSADRGLAALDKERNRRMREAAKLLRQAA
ncbi:CHAD domain-containing protein [Paraburkholderia sp. SIMBA_030]|uniref:CHAD domain-containing protein n=1 Tax=Paraburkholderia sp. SIMBA_030 TaxID=3085773 RepID=UPI00397C621C